ncbi:MAG: CDP-alcohol phosphatidyltransferase family protein [Treponema sp.]|nr:CDP-alcohol phosphatidyltransferase family protein [Treponema sp.]
MLGVYNYTVVLTYLGMLFACAGIHFAFSNSDRSFILSLLCLMIAGVMDMFDGKVASTKKNRSSFEKQFGIQIDSMADLISYGVLPALLVYKLAIGDSIYPHVHPVGVRITMCICAIYLLCALVRLSFFNVDEAERQKNTDEHRHEYKGLPVTSIALVLPAVFIISYFAGSRRPPIVPSTVILAFMGIAFITPFKMIKPGFAGKVLMIAIGIAELVLLFLGKAYCLSFDNPTTQTDDITFSAEQLIYDEPLND